MATPSPALIFEQIVSEEDAVQGLGKVIQSLTISTNSSDFNWPIRIAMVMEYDWAHSIYGTVTELQREDWP